MKKIKFDKNIVNISSKAFVDEKEYIQNILPIINFDFRINHSIKDKTHNYIQIIKNDNRFAAEHLLQKYNLSTKEGVALLSLAESLARIPDDKTAKELIDDKLSQKNWSKYIKNSHSWLTQFSALGLLALGKVIDIHQYKNKITKTTAKLADPITLSATKYFINFLAKEFILGFDIESAFKKARKTDNYLFSFDVLGESARNKQQSDNYFNLYLEAIQKINFYFPSHDEELFDRPNLSVKLSALYPRIEALKLSEINMYLIPKLEKLIMLAQENGITITFDAEECYRQDIYLQILTNLVTHKNFKHFSGIGFVVQAYQKRAIHILNYIKSLAEKTNKVIPVRLVKGAYWDSEIKIAQESGVDNFPVFTKKEYTDANYIACARQLLEYNDYIYPQFATHNAQTIATIEEMAKSGYIQKNNKNFELQKLYGMGNSLYDAISKEHKARIYAPIGKMEDLLSYLIRRLLENGANTSFVNKVNDKNVSVLELLEPVYERIQRKLNNNYNFISLPKDLYHQRQNSKGIDTGYVMYTEKLQKEIDKYKDKIYSAGSIINGNEIIASKHAQDIFRPGNKSEKIGEISHSNLTEISQACESAYSYFDKWCSVEVSKRSEIIRNIAQNLEINKYEIYSLLIREGGKSINDAINEVREAIDFCNYYALQAEKSMQEIYLPGPTGEKNTLKLHPRGIFLCISPWNFPVAIFTGQICAALVTGNTVLAKPAGQTSIIANFIVKLMYKSGIPKKALHLIFASGRIISENLVNNEKVSGIVFTGSTDTAKQINKTLASREGAITPLIAETGGQNAMIVDSSALLEQVTDNVIHSAFYSAGQRCSALRVLYIQEEIYENLIDMLKGAIDQISIGDTQNLDIDVGPVIDEVSKKDLENHVNNMKQQGFQILAQHHLSGNNDEGHYFYPHIIEINSINDLSKENFGPILHVIKYKSNELDKIIEEINNYGYGLTFGFESRVEKKIRDVSSKAKIGNVYVNKGITGAIVESQPFGGEGKSGTGFKAGGPHYLLKFTTERTYSENLTAIGGNVELLSKSD